ncbi:MAG: alpha/beta hydrolase [Leptolyngbyaceae cyanobacterium T60_A2020_046]|nr:alpha/beta hydrolase [Leptolyngbyaceae cyanobacterium T60_A2020_046]
MEKATIALNADHAAYRDTGDGLPLIMLHGFLGDADTWTPLIADLSPHFRCIAVDLLGFGQSSKPRLRYTIWHQVEFLHQFIQALGLRHFALMGHSYGGWVAAAYSVAATGIGWAPDKSAWAPAAKAYTLTIAGERVRHPETIALLAPAGIRDDRFVGRYTTLKPLLWETPVVDWAIAALKPMLAIAGKSDRYTTIARARRALKAQPVAKSFLIDRLKPEDAIDTVERFLPRVEVPTVVFAGHQDTTIPLWHCETYARRLTNGALIGFPEANHDLPQSHAPAIADHLIQRWASLISTFKGI